MVALGGVPDEMIEIGLHRAVEFLRGEDQDRTLFSRGDVWRDERGESLLGIVALLPALRLFESGPIGGLRGAARQEKGERRQDHHPSDYTPDLDPSIQKTLTAAKATERARVVAAHPDHGAPL